MSGEKQIIATTGSLISTAEEQDLWPTHMDEGWLEKEMGHPGLSSEFLSEETGHMANSNTRKHHIGEKEDDFDSDFTMSGPSRGIIIDV